jgi:hypothetical protein
VFYDSCKSIEYSLKSILNSNMVVCPQISIVNCVLLEDINVLFQKVLEKYKRRDLVVVSLHLFLLGVQHQLLKYFLSKFFFTLHDDGLKFLFKYSLLVSYIKPIIEYLSLFS